MRGIFMGVKTLYIAKININENIFHPKYKEMIPLIGEAVLNHNKKEYKEKGLIGYLLIQKKLILMDTNIYQVRLVRFFQ